MSKKPRTLKPILKREQAYIIQMIAELEQILSELDPFSDEYYTLNNDRVMLEQTALYLERRLQGSIPPEYLKD